MNSPIQSTSSNGVTVKVGETYGGAKVLEIFRKDYPHAPEIVRYYRDEKWYVGDDHLLYQAEHKSSPEWFVNNFCK